MPTVKQLVSSHLLGGDLAAEIDPSNEKPRRALRGMLGGLFAAEIGRWLLMQSGKEWVAECLNKESDRTNQMWVATDNRLIYQDCTVPKDWSDDNLAGPGEVPF